MKKTEAAKTARMTFSISVTGPQANSYDGEGLVDFENERDLITLRIDGRTVQLFSDKGDEYFRQGTSGRYRQFPASEQDPVANNPADSLKFVGTDVVDVKKGDSDDCYEGKLDFDRVVARAEEGREDELPEALRGTKAPVVVCLNGSGQIRRYDVDVRVEGGGFSVKSTISDHGRAPALRPLSAGERPG